MPVNGIPLGAENRILTVTLNLAIDKVARTRELLPGGETRVDLVSNLPGGKGINAARAIHSLGGEAWTTGFRGGKNGEFIEDGLNREGIGAMLYPIRGESRVCLIVVDDNNRTSEIYERGPAISEREREGFSEAFPLMAAGFSTVIFSGSLPVGFPPDYYARLMEGVSGRKCLDSRGSQVLEALKGNLFLLKVNEAEFRETFGGEDIARGIPQVLAQYPVEHLAVTLGERGVMAWVESRVVRIDSPYKPPFRCPVGAGDTFMGSLALFLERGMSWLESLVQATAASMSNVSLYQGGEVHLSECEKILPTVRVLPVGP